MTAFMQLFFSVRFVLVLSLIPIGVEGLAQSVNIITGLSAGISESSGLLHLDGRWITHNDSGGEAALYEIDTLTGGISRTVVVENASNVDWEDICADNDFIYIGDFGNNAGSRTDLKIYRIPVEAYLNEGSEAVQSEIIEFSYEDQIDFTPSTFSTNFDAEAMVVMDDSLYIFTKNWGDMQSDIYVLPKEPGTYAAQRRGTIEANGLITGGSYDEGTQKLALCGHNFLLMPFVLEIDGNPEGLVIESMMNRLEPALPAGISRQIEAIFHLDGGFRLTSEASFTGNAALMGFNPLPLSAENSTVVKENLLYPNPASERVNIPLKNGESAQIYDQHAKLVLTSVEPTVSTAGLANGMYTIHIRNKDGMALGAYKLIVNK